MGYVESGMAPSTATCFLPGRAHLLLFPQVCFLHCSLSDGLEGKLIKFDGGLSVLLTIVRGPQGDLLYLTHIAPEPTFSMYLILNNLVKQERYYFFFHFTDDLAESGGRAE